MARASEVLEMLIPNGGWIVSGQEYEGITFLDCDPITKEEFLAGFTEYDAWKVKQDADKAATLQAVLDKLGLSPDEVAALLG